MVSNLFVLMFEFGCGGGGGDSIGVGTVMVMSVTSFFFQVHRFLLAGLYSRSKGQCDWWIHSNPVHTRSFRSRIKGRRLRIWGR